MYLMTIKSGPYDDTDPWEIELMPATLVIGHPKYGGSDSIKLLSDSIEYDNYNGLMDILISYEGPFPEDDCEKLKKYFSGYYGLIIAQNIGSSCHYTQLQPMWDAIFESIICNESQIIATTQNKEVIDTFTDALLKHKYKDLGKISRIDPTHARARNNIVGYDARVLKIAKLNNWDIR